MVDDYYEKIAHFLMMRKTPEGLTTNQKKHLVVQATNFQLIARELYKTKPDEILRRCVLLHEQERVFVEAHVGVAVGHYGGHAISRKVLRVGIWWPTLNGDVTDYARNCDVCQRTGKPSRRDEMLLVP